MKLFYNDASPYARKCAVVAQEKGLGDQVEIDRINVYEMEFREINPLNKIPCLVLEDGTGLFDSYVICDYLDRIGTGPRLIPETGKLRDQVLRLHAIGQGMTDAALNLRNQVMRDGKLDTQLLHQAEEGHDRVGLLTHAHRHNLASLGSNFDTLLQ